jgi:hypothetical protein
MTAGWRRNLGARFLIASCVGGVFLFGAIAAAVMVVLAEKGVLQVAVTAGTAAAGGVLAPLLIERLLNRSSNRSVWDRPGTGIVRPLAVEEDSRTLGEDGGSPAEMLRPEREIIRFRGRSVELNELERWCRQPQPFAVRLCWGAAGVGKTRLARQLGWQLGDEWERGILRAGRADQAMAVIKTLIRPVLLIVDQGDGHHGLANLLTEAIAYDGHAPLRILLFARSKDWWQRIVDESSSVAAERDRLRHVDVELRPDAIDFTDQEQVFERALRGYAAWLHVPVPTTRLTNNDRRTAPVVMTLHAAALAALLGERKTIAIDSTIFTELLDHEASYWREVATAVEVKLNERQYRQVVAVGTLVGAQNPAAAEELLAQLSTLRNAGVPLARIADWLHELYPAPDGEWIGPLQPDALADALVLAELSAEPQLLDVVRRSLAEPAVQLRALAFLARTAGHDLLARELLSTLLSTELERLAIAAMDVARVVPGPLPVVLADALAGAEPNPGLDAVIEKHLVEGELLRLLAELAEGVTRRQLELARADADVPAISRLLTKLGRRLYELGRHEDALTATEESVALYRELAEQRSNTQLRDLANALDYLGNRLHELGRYEDALTATDESVALYRELAEQRSDTDLPDLANSLDDLGNRLYELGRYEDALNAGEESVAVYRELAEQRPDAHQRNLAHASGNLANHLTQLGRHEEALKATEESVALYRELAEQRPDVHTPYLAVALDHLGTRLKKLNRHAEALEATEEAVALDRQLIEQRPGSHLPYLAAALTNLGTRLHDLGRSKEALKAAEEAVDLRRRLAQQRPDAQLPNLGTALITLGIALDDLGQHEDALAATDESVTLYRHLVQQRPDGHLMNLAIALHALGRNLAHLGRHEDALAATEEAVILWRQLAEQRPDAHLPNLADALQNLSNRLTCLNRHKDALAAASECVHLWQAACEDHPTIYRPRLADAEAHLRRLKPPGDPSIR